MVSTITTFTSVHDRRRWLALVVVLLAQLMVVLDMTIVNVALPSIQHELNFSQSNLTWVVNAYLIAFGSFLLLAGRLGDLVGRKRVFLTGLVLFGAASAVCGLAESQTVLVAARFAQGLGGAVATSVIIAIIATGFPGASDRAKAMSAYAFVAAAGGSIGLLAGGAITDALSWHWVFFINVPIAVIAFVLGRALVEESDAIGLSQGVDVLGSLLVTSGMLVGIYAIVTSTEYGWGSAHTLGLGAGALALLAAFLVLESRLANPIMPLGILRVRSLIGSSLVRGALVTGMFSTFFFGVLYLERILHFGPVKTGLAFMPLTLAIGGLSTGITARLVGRFGARRVLLAGLLTVVPGLLLLSGADAQTDYFPTLFVAFALLGLGAGMSFMPLLVIAMEDVPARDAGLASGIVQMSLQISAAVGIAALGTIATDRTQALTDDGHPIAGALTGGYDLAFTIGALCVAGGVVLALSILRAGGRGGAVVERLPQRAPEPAFEAEAA
jgi:EmrB/QacA subfamily drug resistance transporter